MLKIAKLKAVLKEKAYQKRREKLFNDKKKQLINKEFSLFSCNCIGCCVLNDLGLRFNSPFVNLYLVAKDYLKYLKNPAYYNSLELNFIEWNNYPIGMLDDITIYFVHYKTEAECIDAWKRRVERIDYNNLFVLFIERDGCEKSDLLEFDNLPYKNKVVFTKNQYNDIKSSYLIKDFENCTEVGNLINWKSKEVRYYDAFDFVNWFNGGINK